MAAEIRIAEDTDAPDIARVPVNASGKHIEELSPKRFLRHCHCFHAAALNYGGIAKKMQPGTTDSDRISPSLGPYWALGIVIVIFCGWYSSDCYLSQHLYASLPALYLGSTIVVAILITGLGIWRFDPARAKISRLTYIVFAVPLGGVLFGAVLGTILTIVELSAVRVTAFHRQQYLTSVLVTKGERSCSWHLEFLDLAIDRHIEICGSLRGNSRPKSGLEWTVTQDVGPLGLNVVSMTPLADASGTVHMGLW